MTRASTNGVGSAYLDGSDDSRFGEVDPTHAITLPSDAAADGIGELWFDRPAAMEQAMNSPQMAAAVEDATRFLDMERTYALAIDEE